MLSSLLFLFVKSHRALLLYKPVRNRGCGLIALSLMLTCSLGPMAGASADDTEIFFSSAAASGNNRPNVLLVLDTSGSMGATDGGGESRMTRMKSAVRTILGQSTGINVGLMRYNGVYGGGPVLYPITPIDKTICDDSSCLASILAISVDGNWNDVEEKLSNQQVDGTGKTMSLGHDGNGNGNAQSVGIRFNPLNIPRGATILSAELEFTAKGSSSGNASFLIQSENIKDSPIFTSDAASVSARDWNAPGVAWNPGNWSNGLGYESPELSSIVQDVVDRADWCSGSAIAFQITGNGRRTAFTNESATAAESNDQPRLRIQYDASSVPAYGGCGVETFRVAIANGNDDAEQRLPSGNVNLTSQELDVPLDGGNEQRVGMRFQNVVIPRGALIAEATIEFEIRAFRNGQADVTFSGEAADDAAPYQSSFNNLEQRARTSTTVDWTNLPELSPGSHLQTPNLASIIQEIVDRPGWDAGNALSLTLARKAGGGRRSFKSYNQGASFAPELVITFDGDGSGNGSGQANSGSGNGSVAGNGGSNGTPSGTQTGTPIQSAPGTATARDRMIEIVDNLTNVGGTPSVDSFYEAALYYRGEAVDFGRSRGYASNSQWKKQNFRVSHPGSYTGGTVVRDSNCIDANLSHSSCAGEIISGSPIYTSPITSSCQANHVVLLSDGETDRNDVTARIRAMTGDASCADSGDEACATELASWLNDNDHSGTINGSQKITTHTIAFNLEGSGKNFLQRVAIAGGGGSYEADTANELVSVFQDILTSVADVETSFTAPGATVNQFNRLTHRDDIYFAVFKPEGTARWSGNLKRFRVGLDDSGAGDVLIRDLDGAPAIDEATGFFSSASRSYWPERDAQGQEIGSPDGNTTVRGGAANQLSLNHGGGARRVYTWAGSAESVPVGGVALVDPGQALHESNTAITDALLGIEGMAPGPLEQASYRQSLMQWARGVDVLDEDQDGSTVDVRAHLGDPMHAQPVIMNYSDSSGANGTRSIVYLATNEGFVHAIDTETGAEQYAFIPGELLSNLDTFKRNQVQGHPYGLDGPLSIYRTDANGDSIINGDDKAYLYLAMRRGGKQYYAIDVTSPDAPRLAWAIQGGVDGSPGFSEMGQSWSRLAPVSISFAGQQRDVLIFGGGYDVGQDPVPGDHDHALTTSSAGRGLYIVDALDGELLWSGLGQLGGDQYFLGMDYSLPGNVRSIDVNRDGLVDQIYAADTGGQLWRFDLTQQHQSGPLLAGGIIASLGDTLASEQRRFFTEPDVALVDDEGQQFLTVSIGSGWRAHPLDDIIQDRFFVIRQAAVRRAPSVYGKEFGAAGSGVSTPVTASDLEPVAGQLEPAKNLYGWYLDLPDKGEKVLGTSVTFDGSVIFSTYLPSGSSSECSASIGGARAYVLDVKSGAPARDLDMDGDVDLSDVSINLKHGGIPPEASILLTEEGGDNALVFIGPQQIEAGMGIRTQRTFWSDRGEAGDFAPIEVVEGEDP